MTTDSDIHPGRLFTAARFAVGTSAARFAHTHRFVYTGPITLEDIVLAIIG